MSLLLSIIIPTHSRPDCLTDCLKSLTEMKSSDQLWEVLVVDDGGDLAAEEVTRRFEQNLPLRSFRQTNAGPASARNYAARMARGSHLAFLDDDCQLSPDWWVEARRCLSLHNKAAVGGLTTNLLTHNQYAAASQTLVDYLYEAWNGSDKQFFTSNNLMVPKADFLELSGFDQSFRRAAAEDRDLARRWRQAGKPLIYEPRLRVFHQHRLDLRGFLRQHFNYGHGARTFWTQQTRFRMEPLSFYRGMLAYPWRRQGPGWAALSQSFLIGLSQLANAAGFALARRQGRQ